MIISLPLDEFENTLDGLMSAGNYATIQEEVYQGAVWLEEHEGNPVKDDWEKMNNFTALVCQVAVRLRALG